MATEKTLNTRILLKYDTLTNWQNSELVLKAGELAIAVVGETTTTDKGLNGDITKTPIVGIKVGDGFKTFSELNWIQAIAGDVPSWAKQAEMTDVKAAITTAINNLASTGALKALTDRVTTAEGSINDLVDYTDGLKESNTSNVGKTELITKITTQDGKITGYETTPITAAMVKYSDTQTVAAKIAAMDQDRATKATTTALNTAISGAKTTLLGGATEGTDTIASVKQAAADALSAANDASDKVDDEIGKLNKADTAVADNFVTAVSEANGIITVSRAAVTSALGIADSYNKSSNKIATVKTVTNAIEALDVTDTAVADNFVTAVSEVDGKISVSRAAVTSALGFTSPDAYNKTSNPIATKKYVDGAISDLQDTLDSISGALRFRGTVTTDPTSSTTPTDDGMGEFKKGDVLLNTANSKEFIYDGSNWVEIGSENIYAIKSEVNQSIQGLNTRLNTAEGKIGTLETASGDHESRIDTIEGNYATQTYVGDQISSFNTTTITPLAERVGDAEDAIEGINDESNGILAQAKSHANGLVNALNLNDTGTGFVKSVTQTKGQIAVTKGAIALSDIASLIKVIDGTETTGSNIATGDILTAKGYVDNAIDALKNDLEDYAEGQASAAASNAVNGLDSSVAATAATNNQVSVLTGVTQTNGKLTAKTEVKLAAVASTGSTDDLTAGTEVWIFDCGNASRDNNT